MVGVATTPLLRERLGSLINSAKVATDIPTKLDILRQLKADLPIDDPVLVSEFLPGLLDLQSDRFSPVRKLVTEVIGEIGLKHLDFLPEIVPALISLLQDGTPAVVRQAITCGIGLFHSTLKMIAVQGLCSSDLDSSLETSWAWMLNFKEKIYSIAFKAGSNGIRLLALKFVEALILLYTPDPDGSLDPPSSQNFEGSFRDFNISWLRGGHPTLKVGDMSVEATQKLGSLLDLLRFPSVKSLSNSMIVVLIKSLSAIANKRPAFYGRIVPVLLGLDLSRFTNKGVRMFGPCHALKTAFNCCLKCTHPSAAPWRDRIICALREMDAEQLPDTEVKHLVKTNGNIEGKQLTESREEKQSEEVCDAVFSNLGRKRSGPQGPCDSVEDDVSGKRVKPMPTISEDSSRDLNKGAAITHHDGQNSGVSSSRDGGNGPVQQLVAMFGALVAQGEKAFGSLEILISSISAELLAEVVMANMCNLPSDCPAEEDDEVPLKMRIADIDIQYLPSYFADAYPQSSGLRALPLVTDTQETVSMDVKDQLEEEFNLAATIDSAAVSSGINRDMKDEELSASLDVHDEAVPSGVEKQPLAGQCDNDDIGNFGSQIPGLDTSVQPDVSLPDIHASASVTATNIEDGSQEQVSSVGRTSVSDALQSVSTDKSEELSPKGVVADVSSVVSSTATSVAVSHHFVLPKMLAPVVDLDDEQKDHLQKLAFTRIVEAYKQIVVTGAAQVRSSLLVFLSAEFPLELDPWKILQQHILSDYANHDGHELTLRVLYRLHGDAEVESDFFSSTTATSVYETFLLTVAEALRDSLPPSDKSLSRLLCEVPSLPQSVLKFLECLCSPGSCDKTEKDSHSGDRVTQGLSTVWSLILLRPPVRDACLRIALKSAVHHLEEVRMKAIRLVANKLYPVASIAQQIEDFAKEMLLSVTNTNETERMETEVSNKGSISEKTSNEQPSVSRDSSLENHQSCSPGSTSLLVSDAQRCMSLYFALCTKKHSLFREIFIAYKNTSNPVKQAVHDHIPILVRTMGSSPELLEILSDPPDGSENLLMQVLRTLTDGTVPSPQLIHTIRNLYDLRIKDIDILIPILPFLPKEEVLMKFPNLLNLPVEKFQGALTRMLQGLPQLTPVLTPVEVLIAIHGIDPEKDGIPLKKVTDACNICFEQRQIFTQQVLAKVLNQLVEQIPPPLLFMRTVLQAIGAFPALVDFIMDILSRLVSKQIWKYPKLWVGFLKCAQLTKPQSYDVLLKLPPAQLESALTKIPALQAPLAAHANQENFRSSIPRATLVVLGIASDAQVSNQAQSSHTLTQDTDNSEKEVPAERSKESSSAS